CLARRADDGGADRRARRDRGCGTAGPALPAAVQSERCGDVAECRSVSRLRVSVRGGTDHSCVDELAISTGRRKAMRTRRILFAGIFVIGAMLCFAPRASTVAGQAGGGHVAIDADDIGGVVTSAKGPEAGVWVLAETADLPTKLVKIVVTDDRGRYLLPD